jgi:Periplasmic binding protein-like domain
MMESIPRWLDRTNRVYQRQWWRKHETFEDAEAFDLRTCHWCSPAAPALGLQVGGGPRRLAVVGCDDSALAARTVPTLTSLRQPIGQPADRAVDLLTAKLANPRFEAHVLERHQLIIRDSSSPI